MNEENRFKIAKIIYNHNQNKKRLKTTLVHYPSLTLKNKKVQKVITDSKLSDFFPSLSLIDIKEADYKPLNQANLVRLEKNIQTKVDTFIKKKIKEKEKGLISIMTDTLARSKKQATAYDVTKNLHHNPNQLNKLTKENLYHIKICYLMQNPTIAKMFIQAWQILLKQKVKEKLTLPINQKEEKRIAQLLSKLKRKAKGLEKRSIDAFYQTLKLEIETMIENAAPGETIATLPFDKLSSLDSYQENDESTEYKQKSKITTLPILIPFYKSDENEADNWHFEKAALNQAHAYFCDRLNELLGEKASGFKEQLKELSQSTLFSQMVTTSNSIIQSTSKAELSNAVLKKIRRLHASYIRYLIILGGQQSKIYEQLTNKLTKRFTYITPSTKELKAHPFLIVKNIYQFFHMQTLTWLGISERHSKAAVCKLATDLLKVKIKRIKKRHPEFIADISFGDILKSLKEESLLLSDFCKKIAAQRKHVENFYYDIKNSSSPKAKKIKGHFQDLLKSNLYYAIKEEIEQVENKEQLVASESFLKAFFDYANQLVSITSQVNSLITQYHLEENKTTRPYTEHELFALIEAIKKIKYKKPAIEKKRQSLKHSLEANLILVSQAKRNELLIKSDLSKIKENIINPLLKDDLLNLITTHLKKKSEKSNFFLTSALLKEIKQQLDQYQKTIQAFGQARVEAAVCLDSLEAFRKLQSLNMAIKEISQNFKFFLQINQALNLIRKKKPQALEEKVNKFNKMLSKHMPLINAISNTVYDVGQENVVPRKVILEQLSKGIFFTPEEKENLHNILYPLYSTLSPSKLFAQINKYFDEYTPSQQQACLDFIYAYLKFDREHKLILASDYNSIFFQSLNALLQRLSTNLPQAQ